MVRFAMIFVVLAGLAFMANWFTIKRDDEGLPTKRPNVRRGGPKPLYKFGRIIHGQSVYLGDILMAPSNRMVSPFNITLPKILCTRLAYSAGRPSREGNGTCWPSES